MNAKSIISFAIGACFGCVAVPSPAVAQDVPLLMTTVRPAARLPTPGELRLVPTTAVPSLGIAHSRAARLAASVRDGPRAELPIPQLDTVWSRSVPLAARSVANCLELITEPIDNQGIATGGLSNRCALSLRIRAHYGFRREVGACTASPSATIDGILRPARDSDQMFVWQRSDDTRLDACISEIMILGVPEWTLDQAKYARKWLTEKRGQQGATRVAIYSRSGNPGEEGAGDGSVTEVTSPSLCELQIVTSGFGREGQPRTTHRINIRWADVSRVKTYGDSDVRLTLGNAIGEESTWLTFRSFRETTAETGFDGGLAASVLSEFCRIAGMK